MMEAYSLYGHQETMVLLCGEVWHHPQNQILVQNGYLESYIMGIFGIMQAQTLKQSIEIWLFVFITQC